MPSLPPGPLRRRDLGHDAMTLSVRSGAAVVLLAFALPLAACASQPSPEPTASVDVEDEGRAFLLDQGFATNEGRLAPKTPEQERLVAEVIDSGVWAGIPDEDLAWMSLELTLDVCLKAIESGHRVDADQVQAHIDDPGILQTWVRAFEDDDLGLPFMLGGLAISGMTHLCPDDYPDWIAAYRELPIPTG